MSTKSKLTKAQRRALFTVGAWQTWRKYGTFGGKAQSRIRVALKFATCNRIGEVFVREESPDTDWKPVLTEAGKALFDKEFGAPCSEHGWDGVDNYKKVYQACEACRNCTHRVSGYLPKVYEEKVESRPAQVVVKA